VPHHFLGTAQNVVGHSNKKIGAQGQNFFVPPTFYTMPAPLAWTVMVSQQDIFFAEVHGL